jgi:hypothetical protein
MGGVPLKITAICESLLKKYRINYTLLEYYCFNLMRALSYIQPKKAKVTEGIINLYSVKSKVVTQCNSAQIKNGHCVKKARILT